MEKKTYTELLKDPRWQRRKTQILTRDNFTCQLCGDKSTTLHVHHKYYQDGHLPWEYKDDVLVTLCEKCHSLIHANIPTSDIQLKIGDVVYQEHGDYEVYGIVFFIDYASQLVSILTIDSGAGFSDCVVYYFPFNEINKEVIKADNFFNEDSYLAKSLFYCFYGLLKCNKKVHIDYFPTRGYIDAVMCIKYYLNEILTNNDSLKDWVESAEKGTLNFWED